MRFHRYLGTVLLLSLVGCGIAPASRDWVLFECSDGGFRARFPQLPTEETSADGKRQQFQTEYHHGRRALVVCYNHHSDPSVSLNARLENIAVKMKLQTLTAVRAAKVGSYDGLEAEYAHQDDLGTLHYTHRVVYVGRTLYQLIVIAKPGEDVREDATRFFDSFEIMKGDSQGSPAAKPE